VVLAEEPAVVAGTACVPSCTPPLLHPARLPTAAQAPSAAAPAMKPRLLISSFSIMVLLPSPDRPAARWPVRTSAATLRGRPVCGKGTCMLKTAHRMALRIPASAILRGIRRSVV